MDGFQQPRVRRHWLGRDSTIGHYQDAYDFGSLARLVRLPPGHHGDRLYRNGIIDLATDQPVDDAPIPAPTDAVVVVDGSFLQRAEFADMWNDVVLRPR